MPLRMVQRRKIFMKFLSRDAHSHYAISHSFAQGYLVIDTPLRTFMAYPRYYTTVKDASNCQWPITSKEECEEAARELEGLDVHEQLGTSASLQSNQHFPPFCYSFWTGFNTERTLWFNNMGSSTTTCNNFDICICHKFGAPEPV